MTNDNDFLTALTAQLAGLPTVRAVALGGSRATGTHRPDSDWDLAIYYRGQFDPADLRALGHPGEVSEIGGWGGGVFNGGAWLTVEGRRVDVHYRDLAAVEHELAESLAGRFHWEPLAFHLAGIPSYLIVGELAGNQVLHGDVPRPDRYPDALRESAQTFWRTNTAMTLTYATANHAPAGRVTEVAGAVALAALQTAHAVLAGRGQWPTNEKTLLRRADLRDIDDLIAELTPSPEALLATLSTAQTRLTSAS